LNKLIAHISSIAATLEGVADARATVLRHDSEDIVIVMVQNNGYLSDIQLRERVAAEIDEPCPPLGVLGVPELPLPDQPVDPEELRAALNNGWCVLFEPPDSPMEKTLAALWGRALDHPRVGTRDDFLELGGDSLAAVAILAEVETLFGVKLEIQDLMDVATIEGLAEVIAQNGAV